MKPYHLVAALFLLLSSAVVSAGEPFKDSKDVVGAWMLEAVSRGIGKIKTEENRSWEFKSDGTLVTSGYNRVTKMDDRMTFGYRVEDGKLVLIDPGRPNKPQTLEVHERTDKTMTLTGGWEGVYFFRRK
ncbi:MAG TPA: hypothetical protein VI457_13240 [Methylococcaceae bacterium]|nr:hypothetical protein [Methylococcaceae bacterium]